MGDRSDQIRILIVDDHSVVRRGLVMVLTLQADFAVVGEAGTADAALRLAKELQPDLILLDLTLPDREGDAAVTDFRQVSPGCRILVLSGVQDTDRIRKAVNAGIDGFVPKEVNPNELVRAIRQVAAGQSYIHPDVLHQLQHEVPAAVLPPVSLTQRELEVLQLMATTATNREIAELLVLSEETVRSHVKNILRKLDQSNRTQAVLAALRQNLIQV